MKPRRLNRRTEMPYWINKLSEDVERARTSKLFEALDNLSVQMEIAKAYLDKPEVLQ